MPLPLDGRTALVTGAASGIGAAIARRLVADGAAVLAVDRDKAGIVALAGELPGVEPVVCDLSDLDAVDKLPAEVDVLVDNAGIQHVAPLPEFDPEMFSLILRLMLEAPFRLARRVPLSPHCSNAPGCSGSGPSTPTSCWSAAAGGPVACRSPRPPPGPGAGWRASTTAPSSRSCPAMTRRRWRPGSRCRSPPT